MEKLSGFKLLAQLPDEWKGKEGIKLVPRLQGDGVIVIHPDLKPLIVTAEGTVQPISLDEPGCEGGWV